MVFPVFITAHAGRFEHHRSIEREKLSTFSCHWDPFWSFDHFLAGSNHVYRWRECHLSWLGGAWLIDIDRFRQELKEATERSAAVFKCHVCSCDMRVSEAFCKLLVWDYTLKIPAGQKDVYEKVPVEWVWADRVLGLQEPLSQSDVALKLALTRGRWSCWWVFIL